MLISNPKPPHYARTSWGMLVSTVLWFHEVSATLATSWTLACDWNYRHSTRGTWPGLAIGDENILDPTFENIQTRKGKETPQRDVTANVSNSSFRKLSWHRKCTWNLTPRLGHTLTCIFLGERSSVTYHTKPLHFPNDGGHVIFLIPYRPLSAMRNSVAS